MGRCETGECNPTADNIVSMVILLSLRDTACSDTWNAILAKKCSSGSSGRVREGGKKHEIYAAAFGGHLFVRPQTKWWKGNVFTPVCQSFCSQGGVCLSACWDTHTALGRHPPGRHSLPSAYWDTHPPCQVHAGIYTPCPVHAGIDMATAADCTHPTGMHSCYDLFLQGRGEGHGPSAPPRSATEV